MLSTLKTIAQRIFHPPKRAPGPTRAESEKEHCDKEYFLALEYPVKLTKRYGEVIQVPLLGCHMLTGAQGFEHVIKTQNKNYERMPFFYQTRLSALFGKSILVTEGDYWKQRRKQINPVFHPSLYPSYAPVITGMTEAYLNGFIRKSDKINVLKDMNDLVLRIVLKLFSQFEPSAEFLSRFSKDVQFCNWYISHSVWLAPWKPTWNNLKFQWYRRRIDKSLLAIIKDRQRHPTQDNDLLNILMPHYSEDSEILAEFKTLVLTGHETTAISLSWMWYLLALNPEYRDLMEEELQTVLAGRLPTPEDLPKLSFTKAVILESLRLYPAIWSIARNNIEEDFICGYYIPKKSPLILNIYALHRNPTYWEEPDTFYPPRFLGDAAKERHPFAYLPFIGGAHTCIAHQFAIMEMLLITATLAQRVRFEIISNTKVVPEPCISLRPRHGIKMRLMQREKRL
jgi:cytochrome P450